MKCALQLVEYDFEVKLESTMHADLADLLTSRENLREKELTKIREALFESVIEDAFTLCFDGAFHKATHSAVGGFVIKDPNEAEYATLCYSHRMCKARDIKRLTIKGGSLLVIKQIQGVWKCQSDGLRTFYKEALTLIKCFHKV